MKINLIGRYACMSLFLSLASCISEQVQPTESCSIFEITVDQLSNTQCGADNGSFALSIQGGTSPFTFEAAFETNQTGAFTNIAAGNYTVMITDANGCTGEIDVSIQNEDGVIIDEVIVTDAGCGTSQGSILVNASAGKEPFTYSLNGGVGQGINIFSGLQAGDYQVLVTDALGCEITQNAEVLAGISYQSAIKVIIDTNCAISGCHNGSVAPDLRSFAQRQISAARIKARTANGSMPRGRTLTQSQIDQIACWVDDGALDN